MNVRIEIEMGILGTKLMPKMQINSKGYYFRDYKDEEQMEDEWMGTFLWHASKRNRRENREKERERDRERGKGLSFLELQCF